jgi:uncharacterized protein (DUF983 family)
MTSNIKPNWKAAFFGKCPACGKYGVFKGLIKTAENCAACGTDLTIYETADGPAFFAISVVGTLVGILAAVVEVIYAPAFWVHLALWVPSILLGSWVVIRVTKTLMIAHQMKLKS